MRRTNWRVVFTGIFLIVLAIGFYFFMLTIVPKSNNPAEMMQTVGTISGVASGISGAMIVFGLIGKKVPAK